MNRKTGTGSYTYGNTAHPHQVTGVSNTGGSIILQVQDDKFYWDDYEEKVVGSDTLHYYYVSGTDGLAGLHIVKTNLNNQTTTHTTKVITDHLGSIVSLADNSDYVYDARFDVWGNREIGLPYWFDPGFDRGYTGHEHLEQIGLINMNGRMYDPVLGRFLSPDPFIQSPSNPQNYNRYSYCLNNPLKYTDPSGELFWEAVLIGAAFFGAGNLMTHSIRGDVNNFGDCAKYFFQGALAGAALGATWYIAPSIPVVGNAIQGYMTWSFQCKLQMTAISAISGVGIGICTGNWNPLLNSVGIFLGNFYIDENAGFLEGVWQGFSRHSWESLQTGLGHSVNQFLNVFGEVNSIKYGYGAIVVESKLDGFGGFTIGSFIHGDLGIKASSYDNLFQHEYGHYLQSRRFGVVDLFAFSIESFFSYSWAKDHRQTYTEIDANRRAFKYFLNNVEGFGEKDENGYWSSKNWYWQENPLEKEMDRFFKFKEKYKF